MIFSFIHTTIIVNGFQLLTLGFHQLQKTDGKILLQKSRYKPRWDPTQILLLETGIFISLSTYIKKDKNLKSIKKIQNQTLNCFFLF